MQISLTWSIPFHELHHFGRVSVGDDVLRDVDSHNQNCK